MYAVFKTGGKQYRAAPGDTLKIEKLEAEKGASIELDQVLLVGEGEDVVVGDPLVEGGVVTATVVDHGRAKKIKIIKFKRRKHHRKQMGHRQYFTEIEITGVSAKGAKAKKPAKKEEVKPATAELKFMDAPNGTPDDLKKISGVGPVLEKKLHALGIYHFSQVAAFTADEIAAIDEELNFKGRIERDNWLEQASQFAAASQEEE